ncbi:MAG: hypothetical protein HY719_00350 [Planctomycetes bacterium]|nr:hypothetical protein [Planctomycetota bacterium]
MVWDKNDFPRLQPDRYRVTSPEDKTYNCIAFAVGETYRRWDTNPGGYYWPDGIELSEDQRVLVNLFEALGYKVCDNADPEEGIEKVALYQRDGKWTHAARQSPNGSWLHKLGDLEDICSQSPEDVCGGYYGEILVFMARPRS